MQTCLSSVATRCSIPILTPTTWSPARAKNWSVPSAGSFIYNIDSCSSRELSASFCLVRGVEASTRVGGFFFPSFVVSPRFQFEYQQAQLEAEIENLSWKVERADSYERGVVGGEGELSASDRGVSACSRGGFKYHSQWFSTIAPMTSVSGNLWFKFLALLHQHARQKTTLDLRCQSWRFSSFYGNVCKSAWSVVK